jgi:galactokinase
VNQAKEPSGGIDRLRLDNAPIYRAPGRVNLIGEHTDYNGGFVMPAAIDFSTLVAISPRTDRVVSAFSHNLNEEFSFSLDDLSAQPRGHWGDYVQGVALELEQAGYRLKGADLRIEGEVPIGAGLSSSAAIEVATGYALLKHSGYAVDRNELAKICQRAENNFVGMRCGIMDQFVACQAQEGRALMLDCRSLEYQLLPLPPDVRLAICNTMVKHQLASSEYNKRRAECEEGVRHFRKQRAHVHALRDVNREDLETQRPELSDVVYRRCRHVISENGRVLQAKDALSEGNILEFGRLMNESHSSLRDDYEVSCEELDLMVALANECRGVIGARMTGGGFGGCTINLVAADCLEAFKENITTRYAQTTGRKPAIYVCTPSQGVGRLASQGIR